MSILTDLNPTSLAIKALVVIAAVGGAYAWGDHNGFSREQLVYNNYVLKQKDAAESQVIANKTALDAAQKKYASDLLAIQTEYTQNAQHLQSARDAAFASAASYSSQLQHYLSIPHASPEHAVLPGAASGSQGTAASGQGATQLLDGVSSLNWYLTQRFSDADAIAITLNEAIDVIDKDRATCNGALPGVSEAPQ